MPRRLTHVFAFLILFDVWTSVATSRTTADNSYVIEPIKDGEDVGVVIVAGAYMYYDQYIALGK